MCDQTPTIDYNHHRPTRLRRSAPLRHLVREHTLSLDHIVYPVFLVEGSHIKREIASLPQQYHYSIDALLEEIPAMLKEGIKSLLLFASLDTKSTTGRSGAVQDGLVQRAIRQIKGQFPQLYLIADVCLCTHKEDGHCCIYTPGMEIDARATLEVLSEIALSYAQAGVDMVAPSDMMDGRIASIRQLLDRNTYEHVGIMAYSAKYASAFYGPFREAAHSAPAFGDRRMYQLDPANAKEALREIKIDIQEGADIVMVKPAMPYLDIVARAQMQIEVPLAAFQVSGEYALLYQGVKHGIVDSRAIYESLIALKRSGATIIITYFARQIHTWLATEEGK